jgi:hypothetical protein
MMNFFAKNRTMLIVAAIVITTVIYLYIRKKNAGAGGCPKSDIKSLSTSPSALLASLFGAPSQAPAQSTLTAPLVTSVQAPSPVAFQGDKPATH